MITDPRPRIIARRTEFDRSDQMVTLPIPGDSRLRALALEIESALSAEVKKQE